MKTKAKKTDKKTSSPSKKDVKSASVGILDVLSARQEMLAEAEIAPAPVQTSEVVSAAPVVSERRTISNDERRRLIALAAYYRAQRAGFGKTNPVEDWLVAEREVSAMIDNGEHI